MTDADEIHNILGQIRQTSGSEFESRITFGSNFGVGRGLRSLSALLSANVDAFSSTLAVWLSGNALASINVVALRQTRLVLGWVTVCGRVNHFGM